MIGNGFRDMHAHFIYGVDDGAKSAEEMKAMLDLAVTNHVTELYATSHFTPGIRHFPETTYREHFAEAQAYCKEKGHDLRLYPGAEILYTPGMRNYMERRPMRTLGDSESVLMEFVPDVSYSDVEEAVSLLEEYGYDPILAHVERYPCLYGSKFYKLKETHRVRYQMNCGTVIKEKGLRMRLLVRKWLKDELIDFISSDMHDTTARRNRMQEAYEALQKSCPEGYLKRLFQEGI